MPTLAFNKRAGFDYDLLETLEGGLKLTGAEVKSVRAGHVQFKGAFLHVFRGELWLKNLFISPYAPAADKETHDPGRDRKVLVKKRELARLAAKTHADGLTLVPISLYTRGSFLKLGFALARGKKRFEKRDAIKKREVNRELRERMKE
ncbi:SsrA-binding protein SmpB [Patescibacteria group bacterium]|nr:MAG: SsrA-binding protein SmpB [Patescibacteria group bacterium]